jgi:hypothetical protein
VSQKTSAPTASQPASALPASQAPGADTAGQAPGSATGQTTRVPTVAGRLGDIRASIRRSLSGTPGRLWMLALAAAAVSLIFGVGAFSAFGSADTALRRGGENATQLIRVQAIHTNLVRADADATNSFLVGGLEPASQRTSYTSAVQQASRLIAEAAKAQPADGPALGALNSTVITYAGLIEQARATNRQALPVGAQYLRIASSGLRSDALPILDALVNANDARVGAEFDAATRASAALVATALLALLVLAGGMIWLSRRTHRYVNAPLVAATVAILVTLVVGFLVLAGVSSRVGTVRDGSYAATLAAAKARIAAFDAKSNESLTWKSSSKVVSDQSAVAARLDSRASRMGGLWKQYADTHVQIRQADDAGQWESAVREAVGSGPSSANATFDAFDTSSAAALAATSRATSDSLDAPQSWLPLAAWLGLLIGIAGAVSAWWGVSLRLEEYR